ncbi:amino acid permease-domain-containing protein [Lipomyces japonicus]|uniref:amino acid permease-domain-containing protein n=1 Tax=Lipomyces japonicus TaxID=56871 RepID=UPI0034CD5E8A
MPSQPKHTPLQSRDSFELASLVSSSELDGDASSSRGSADRLSHFDFEDDEDLRQHLSFENVRRESYAESLFNYGDHLIPLAASAENGNGQALPLEKQKKLTVLNGLSLVIGLQIGSGIFSSPSQVDSQAGSPGASIIVWLIAGLLVWTGASSYAELGSAIPLNGGAQAYLHHIFGPLPAFLFAWTAIIILKPGSTAIIGIVFAEYMGRLIFSPSSTHDGINHGETGQTYSPVWFNKLVGIAAILLITFINIISTRLGTRTGDIFLFIKIGSLVVVTVIGIIYWLLGKGAGNFSEGWFYGSSDSLGNYAIALYAGLWAFDGWDNLNYVAAEMKNASRDLPKVIHYSMPIVIISYLSANLAYYIVLPSSELKKSSTIGLAFGELVFGRVGAIVFTITVALSCFGALNAIAFTSARLVYVSGKDGFLPSMFGKINKRTDTPINALILQAALTILFILAGEFKTLLTFYGVAGYVFYFLTVLGVIVLRVREPQLERPYKTFITTPILFCCVALFLISRGIFSAPMEALFAALFVLLGIPIYYLRAGGGLYNMPLFGRFFKPKVRDQTTNVPLSM